MRKNVLSMLLALVLLVSLGAPVLADGPEVTATNQAITVDGKAVTTEVYNIDGSNYFKLRDVAELLNGTSAQFSVSYDEETRTVTAQSGKAYTPVGGELASGSDKSSTCVESTQTIAVNAIVRDISAYNIGGNNFFKLRDLGDLLGFGVSYDGASRTVVVDSDDPLNFSNAVSSTVKPHLDGKEITVTMYEDCYTASPNRLEDQKISIYVPENATAASPIIFLVNNSGWQSNAYSGRTQVKSYGKEMQTDRRTGKTSEVTVGDYKSDSDTDAVGRALAEGYVIVSYGCRSRNNGLTGEEYLGHSPATMTDTKAAIRYLKYNAAALPAGDTGKIVVTGTSGGGALSTVIAASGNSPDYYASLYEIGAAGITCKDGKYTDTLSDDVFGVIAYCPITDLGNADAGYEWTYHDTREALYDTEGYDFGYGIEEETIMTASEELVKIYTEYFNGLGLRLKDGKALTAANLEDAIIGLMETEIAESIREIGVEQMKADLAAADKDQIGTDWLVLKEDGSFTYDYEKHLYFLAYYTTLKPAPSFSNVGIPAYAGQRNEDNLFGSVTDEYSPFNAYSWSVDDTKNAVGKDDTGMTWDAYMKTDAGKALAQQIRMASAVAYLVDENDGDSAPYWYVRHGMADRDTSFAVEASLFYAIENDETIKDGNYEFAWYKPHSGNYDVKEAYTWLKSIVGDVKKDSLSLENASSTELTAKVDGKDIKVSCYTAPYVSNPNRPEDQKINIYIPENATSDSPIIFNVNNGGWMMNSYPSNTVEDGKDYDGTNDKTGVALKEGYVIVSYGCRGRGNGETNGKYLGHSPATMTDTKAAIRYLRYNAAKLPAGDTDKIVVTGTSGGGALSTVIAASGNSPDFYESLYEIGAAGIQYSNGTYTSTLGDDVYATIAYCPITDLGHADAAYEWTYSGIREQLYAEGLMSYKGADEETVMENSAILKDSYPAYVASLGLKTEDGKDLTAEALDETIITLMKAEIEESIQEYGIKQMKADIAAKDYGEDDWLTLNDDGTYTYDYDKHLYYVARNTPLKISCAFSNFGTGYGEMMNEDNLFGSVTQAYSPFEFLSWKLDAAKGNGVGYDDTGLEWNDYMKTGAGKNLAKQIRMTSAVDYLADTADGDSAPYWYVRHGMADRDTSFAVEGLLYLAMVNDGSIKDVNFEFAWLQPHAGNYDVAEAYTWLKTIL